ncbi:MAG: hypothetical protein J0H46_18120 [Bacteroidetes bacterium]|nr:hypothetical protein [Bacteroidota bacterium]
MKKTIFAVSLSCFILLGYLNATAQSQADSSKPKKEQKVKQYTCPMHPEVVTDKPGKCPKCHMTLVEKKKK